MAKVTNRTSDLVQVDVNTDASLEKITAAVVNDAINDAIQVCEADDYDDSQRTSQPSQQNDGMHETCTVAYKMMASEHISARMITEDTHNSECETTQNKTQLQQGEEKSGYCEDEEQMKALRDQIPEARNTADMNAGNCTVSAGRPTELGLSQKKKIMPTSADRLPANDNDDSDVCLSDASDISDIAFGRSVLSATTPDELNTPDLLNSSVFSGSLDWEESDTPVTPVEPIPEYTAEEEMNDNRSWKVVEICGKQYRIDMKVVEPYKKVISHGGYYGDGFNAIVVLTACHLPDKRRRDYHYVMDHLFLYVLSTLELLVVDDYMMVYFHGAAPQHKIPSLRWLKRCYDMIDRRLRKNLKSLLIVHPTFWLKTVVLMTKPFVSSKFSAKLRYIHSLSQLYENVPSEYIYIPDEIKQYDSNFSKSSSPT